MYGDLGPHPITVAGHLLCDDRSSLHRNLAARGPFDVALPSTGAEAIGAEVRPHPPRSMRYSALWSGRLALVWLSMTKLLVPP